MGAILLSGLGAVPERGRGVEWLVANASQAGIDMAGVFRWVFVAADIFLGLALTAMLLMEERPLHGAASAIAPAPSQATTAASAQASRPT